MATTRILESNIVINTIEVGDSYNDVMDYVVKHRHMWADRNVLWDATILFEAGVNLADEVHSGIRKLATGHK